MKKNTFLQRPYFSVYSDTKEIHGKIKHYEVINFGPRVGAILIHKNKILLVKQYRYLIDRCSMEIPGGSVNDNESIIEAVEREVMEETGCSYSKLRHLIDYYPGLDNVDNKTSIYFRVLTDLDNLPLHFSNDEIESLQWLSLPECIELIKSGEILDAMTSLAILAYSKYELQS
ncbi:MAG: NUDIX hydrolase [bacterium]|nr:NUDIX hydrolase [bacterium]